MGIIILLLLASRVLPSRISDWWKSEQVRARVLFLSLEPAPSFRWLLVRARARAPFRLVAWSAHGYRLFAVHLLARPPARHPVWPPLRSSFERPDSSQISPLPVLVLGLVFLFLLLLLASSAALERRDPRAQSRSGRGALFLLAGSPSGASCLFSCAWLMFSCRLLKSQ